MDLLAMHGNEVDAPLNISPHNLLFLLKEATSLTIILSPTVKHSLTEIIDKINGTAPPEESRQRDTTNLSTQVALQATAAAAADTLANKLTAAKATVTRATAQKDLTLAISVQAQTIAEEAACARKRARVALTEACCARSTVIDPIKIAQANEQIKIAEVTLCEMDKTATKKGHIAYGANAFEDRACEEYEVAVKE